ncbi:MAG: hypothetical protein ACT4QE_01865 [Anaerolineales bacterium]
MSDPLTAIAAVISSIVAITALWFSARANKIANASLELALKQDARRKSDLKIYLHTAILKRFRDEQYRVYVFQVSVSNQSEADNSLRAIELALESETGTNVVLRHDAGVASNFPGLKTAPFTLPAKIGNHETLKGSALFRASELMMDSFLVNTYTFKVIDTVGGQFQIEPIVVNETIDEKEGLETNRD